MADSSPERRSPDSSSEPSHSDQESVPAGAGHGDRRLIPAPRSPEPTATDRTAGPAQRSVDATEPRPVVVVGAAGEVARVVVRTLLRHRPDLHLLLTDLDIRALAEFARELPADRVTLRQLDLHRPADLREAVGGAALVINGAGPFTRTAPPVIEACAEARVDYLDYDDDPASTVAAIEAEAALARSGIRCRKGCGHSPGFTNVLAVDVAAELDELDSLDVCWALGDEGPHVYGRAVIEHWLEVIHGPVPSWRDGRATTVEAFRYSEVIPLAGGLGDFRLYEVGHPEPITLPRRFPGASSIRCLGGLHPPPVNGLSSGIAGALGRGVIDLDEAVHWVQRVFNDQSGPLKVWRHAGTGIWRQYRRREVAGSALLRFLWDGLRGRHHPWQGAAAVRATGVRDGERVSLLRRTPAAGPGSSMWSSLATCTGIACAAFTTLALADRDGPTGLLFPEDWVRPDAFYRTLTGLGVRAQDVVDPLVRLPGPTGYAASRE